MTKKAVMRAAKRRGIFFTGEKKFLNTLVGVGYSCFSPSGRGILQSATLEGMYGLIKEFPVIPVHRPSAKERYAAGKAAAQSEAVDFSLRAGDYAVYEEEDMSYGELAVIQDKFRRMARRYGLCREFRENGII